MRTTHRHACITGKFARLVTNPNDGLSHRIQFVDTELTGDAFLRLEAAPKPKHHRQRHAITLPKIGPKP